MCASATDNIVHDVSAEPAKRCTFRRERGTRCSQRSSQKSWLKMQGNANCLAVFVRITQYAYCRGFEFIIHADV